MTIKRGTGRQALIEATAEALRAGREVQIKEIASAVGVSHSLVYRHFPDGGKEEMVAEGYAHIFRGLAEADIDTLFDRLQISGIDETPIREFILTLLSPKRADVRWLRLEALAQSRRSPFIAARIEEARRQLIDSFATRLRDLEPRMTIEAANAFAILAQALPLGVTAIGGPSMSKERREVIAQMWAGMLMDALRRAAVTSANPSPR